MSAINLDGGKLHALLGTPEGMTGQWLAKKAHEVETEAKRLAPVDTGRLRASITTSLSTQGGKLQAQIGSDVVYAIYQEFGTRYQSGTPFLRPALLKVMGR